METWITALVAPATLLILTWITNRTGRRIDETQKLVTLLQQEIGRLNIKIEKLETKVETRDEALERKSIIIQEAFRCRTPSSKCPVLIKQSQLNDYAQNSTGAAQPQSGQHSPQCDPLSGGDCGDG